MANLIHFVAPADRSASALIKDERLRDLNFIKSNQSVGTFRAGQAGAQAVAPPPQENPAARGAGEGTSQPGSMEHAEGNVDKQMRGATPDDPSKDGESTDSEKFFEREKPLRVPVIQAKKRRLLVT